MSQPVNPRAQRSVAGMVVAAVWGQRGIPGGGTAANRRVARLYLAGTVLMLLGSVLLSMGFARALW